MNKVTRGILGITGLISILSMAGCGGSSGGGGTTNSTTNFLQAGINNLQGEWLDVTTGQSGSFSLPISSNGTITGGTYTLAGGQPVQFQATGSLSSTGLITINSSQGSSTEQLSTPISGILTGSGTSTSGDQIYVVFNINNTNPTLATAASLAGHSFTGAVVNTAAGQSTVPQIAGFTIDANGNLSGYQLVNNNGAYQFATLVGTETVVPSGNSSASITSSYSYTLTLNGTVISTSTGQGIIDDFTSGSIPTQSEIDINNLNNSVYGSQRALFSETGITELLA
jgi:hypothetical protein